MAAGAEPTELTRASTRTPARTARDEDDPGFGKSAQDTQARTKTHKARTRRDCAASRRGNRLDKRAEVEALASSASGHVLHLTRSPARSGATLGVENERQRHSQEHKDQRHQDGQPIEVAFHRGRASSC